MGLFKKLFSIGSKKAGKRRLAAEYATPLPSQDHLEVISEDDQEAAVTRLLRSTSPRFVVESEDDDDFLAPLPHPINQICSPAASTTSLLASISTRSNYTVTLTGRTVHSRTEFPNANLSMNKPATPERSANDDTIRQRAKSTPLTPQERSRLGKLRADPSVASLLDAYDEHGCLDSEIFSNTPPTQKVGRRQKHRTTGSTLRSLMGVPDVSTMSQNSTDNVVSWAERCLGDDESLSSSSGLATPTDVPSRRLLPKESNSSISYSTECETSMNTFNSLEVELSDTGTEIDETPSRLPYDSTQTNFHASQVFDFLTEKKKVSSPVPPQPSTSTNHRSRRNSDPSSDRSNLFELPSTCDTKTPQQSQARHSLLFESPDKSILANLSRTFSLNDASTSRRSCADQCLVPPVPPLFPNHTGQDTRGPRGLRAFSKLPMSRPYADIPPLPVAPFSAASRKAALSLEEVISGAQRSAIPRPSKSRDGSNMTPRRGPRPRTSSRSSSKGERSTRDPRRAGVSRSYTGVFSYGYKTKSPSPKKSSLRGKENELVSSSRTCKTPTRNSSKANKMSTPSPVSSSELSPVGQQLMTDLRQQRIQARLRDRKSGKLGSGQSRIRY
ncbi:hypothetical protein CONPUDRAFT_74789 [Coniophora puteana RWD-64-598 SS2]|uniref:Uncharacterized protein n=1 Tax=Coniophora puteana (strain RWD-64-598) TaxID=741705 RepID=A0A5M3MKY1_CONPW|nr:uncharacterized protein CONPUDRAFT_74789 [Coniophora puteana RWD-64-598 SS2]EIW79325.1 hypothetical protein CONPUDRAFT_74789 [Coniophora puteana RWD-64-598 SS2]